MDKLENVFEIIDSDNCVKILNTKNNKEIVKGDPLYFRALMNVLRNRDISFEYFKERSPLLCSYLSEYQIALTKIILK